MSKGDVPEWLRMPAEWRAEPETPPEPEDVGMAALLMGVSCGFVMGFLFGGVAVWWVLR